MRRAWINSLFGLLICAAWSPAQSPSIAPALDPAPPTDTAGDASPPALSQPADESDPSRFWLTAEYLFWKVPGQSIPALVGTIPVESAELVQRLPDNKIAPVFGGTAEGVNYGEQSGLRLGAGAWLDGGHQFGLEVGFFQLEQGRQHTLLSSAAEAPLGVTFNDPTAGHQVLIMDAVPGMRDGAVAITGTNRLWGAEANARFRLPVFSIPAELNLLAGFRYLQFDEGLDVSTSSSAVPGGRLPCG
jgi:Putative beta barrel porin-7 (BBP7)